MLLSKHPSLSGVYATSSAEHLDVYRLDVATAKETPASTASTPTVAMPNDALVSVLNNTYPRSTSPSPSAAITGSETNSQWGLPLRPCESFSLRAAAAEHSRLHRWLQTVSVRRAATDDSPHQSSRQESDRRAATAANHAANPSGSSDEENAQRSAARPRAQTVGEDAAEGAHQGGHRTGKGRSLGFVAPETLPPLTCTSLSLSCSEGPLVCFMSDNYGGGWLSISGLEQNAPISAGASFSHGRKSTTPFAARDGFQSSSCDSRSPGRGLYDDHRASYVDRFDLSRINPLFREKVRGHALLPLFLYGQEDDPLPEQFSPGRRDTADGPPPQHVQSSVHGNSDMLASTQMSPGRTRMVNSRRNQGRSTAAAAAAAVKRTSGPQYVHPAAVTASGWDPLDASILAIGRRDGHVQLLDVNYAWRTDRTDEPDVADASSSQSVPPFGDESSTTSSSTAVTVLHERTLHGVVTALDWVPQSHVTVVAAKRSDGYAYYAEALDFRSPDSGVMYLGSPPQLQPQDSPQYVRTPTDVFRGGGESGSFGSSANYRHSFASANRVVCYAEHLACDMSQHYVATVGPHRDRDILQLWDLRATSQPIVEEVFKRAGYTSLAWQEGSSDFTVFATTREGQMRSHTFNAPNLGRNSGGTGGGGGGRSAKLGTAVTSSRSARKNSSRSGPGSVTASSAPYSGNGGGGGGGLGILHPGSSVNVDEDGYAPMADSDEANVSGTDGGTEDLVDVQSRYSAMSAERGAGGSAASTSTTSGTGRSRMTTLRVKPTSAEKYRVFTKVPVSRVVWLPKPSARLRTSLCWDNGGASPQGASLTRPQGVEDGETKDLDGLLLLNMEDGKLYFQVFNKYMCSVTTCNGGLSMLASGPNTYLIALTDVFAGGSGDGSASAWIGPSKLLSWTALDILQRSPTQQFSPTSGNAIQSPVSINPDESEANPLFADELTQLLIALPVTPSRVSCALQRAQDGFGANPMQNMKMFAQSGDDREAYIAFRYGIIATATLYGATPVDGSMGGGLNVHLPSTATLPGVMGCLCAEVRRHFSLWRTVAKSVEAGNAASSVNLLFSGRCPVSMESVGKRYRISEIRRMVLRSTAWETDGELDVAATDRKRAASSSTAVKQAPPLIPADKVELMTEIQALERRVAILIILRRLLEAAQLLSAWRHLHDVYPALSMLLMTFTLVSQPPPPPPPNRTNRPAGGMHGAANETESGEEPPSGAIAQNMVALAHSLSPWMQVALHVLHQRNTTYQEEQRQRRQQRQHTEQPRGMMPTIESAIFSPFMHGVPGTTATSPGQRGLPPLLEDDDFNDDVDADEARLVSTRPRAKHLQKDETDIYREEFDTSPLWDLEANKRHFIDALHMHPCMSVSDRLALATALLLPDPLTHKLPTSVTPEDSNASNDLHTRASAVHNAERMLVLNPLLALLTVCSKMAQCNPGSLFNAVLVGLGPFREDIHTEQILEAAAAVVDAPLQTLCCIPSNSACFSDPAGGAAGSLGMCTSNSGSGSPTFGPNPASFSSYTSTVDGGGMTRCLQMYVDVSGDVQLPTCLAACFGPVQSAKWDFWNTTYREWLNESGLHVARCRHDLSCLRNYTQRDAAAASATAAAAVAAASATSSARASPGMNAFPTSTHLMDVAVLSPTTQPSVLGMSPTGDFMLMGSAPGSPGSPGQHGLVRAAGYDMFGVGVAVTSPYVLRATNPARAVELRCGCGQAMHSSAPSRKNAPTALHGASQRRQMMPCQNPDCRRVETPICTVCSERMESRKAGLPPDLWFVWCTTCLHGGHLKHWREWFQKHSKCPVEDCKCHCHM